MFFTLPEGEVTSSNATEPTTSMLIGLLGTFDERHQPPRTRRGTKESLSLDFEDCRYFPTISFNFAFVAAGIFFLSVRIAWANADPHLQERSRGMSAIVWRTTFAAFSAFLIRTATI